MKIYGLYGKSGTGKSFQAMNLSRELDVESIIDDGLFIWKNRVAAGNSAKRQPTKIKAIKTALFTDDSHCAEVRKKIAEISPEKILVLGTSVDMVEKIIKRLALPEPFRMIPIEEITTESERETARKQRKEMGKHVIPAPTFQIKKQFFRLFSRSHADARNIGGKTLYAEKTVVRPTYSYLGKYDLSDKVISDIVQHVGSEVAGLGSVLRVQTENSADGVKIDVSVLMEYNMMIVDAAKELQQKAIEAIEAMTAFHIMALNVQIKGLK